ncbi:MAG: hypothetical protein F4047_15220 [Caldilineaceae bacterium SB0670_bin_27]|uniref:Uncharacterized protein n=1 Tax=Caldilineaceae bacterium SB0664_bin_27 TaxID=2605260 RepID=A0A6B0YWP1_9CHLR|nr:hypothetical protein [Caldilineaceae bacterium SB0664_bin_27]MYJ79459.1 hypothetical protein [Caldilineaceae bacterium SB0670_bin_27]
MTTIEKNLSAYEADVEFPDVSGMEHLQMLMTRSALHRVEDQLTPAQKIRLAKADKSLLQRAHLFYQAVQTIAELARWRETEEDVTPEHWWWYLDVLAQLPAGVVIAEFSGFSVEP